LSWAKETPSFSFEVLHEMLKRAAARTSRTNAMRLVMGMLLAYGLIALSV
jgi:hypothetical protein